MSPSQLSWMVHVFSWLSAMAGREAALQSANFRRAASGRLPPGQVAIWKKARSSLDCSRQCLWPACCSYGYSHTARQCRLFSASHLGGFQAAEGFDYFVRCPVRLEGGCTRSEDCAGTANTMCSGGNCKCKLGYRLNLGPGTCVANLIRDSCDTTVDCITNANAECRYGTCQCVAGYHFHPTSGSCVASCSNGYGEGYYEVRNYGLRRNNIECTGLFTSNEANCWDLCRDYRQCSTFELKDGECCVQNSTALKSPGDYWNVAGSSYYQRDCA